MKTELVFRPDPKDVPEINRRGKLVTGQPFVSLPDAPNVHKVVGEFKGHKIRIKDVEMVFNDAMMMDFIYGGIGPTTAGTDDEATAAIRQISTTLYGDYGATIKQCFGTWCLECKLQLPEHRDSCTAGKKYVNAGRASNRGQN